LPPAKPSLGVNYVLYFILQPLAWLHPLVSVFCNGKFVPTIGISSSTLADFAQVTTKVDLSLKRKATNDIYKGADKQYIQSK